MCPWDLYVQNPYSTRNTDGFVSLAYAENKLIWPHVEEWFKHPLTQVESLYDYTFGGARLRRGFIRFLELTTTKTLSPHSLVGGDGALAVLESMAFCLFDPGDRVALLVPCYVQHRNILTYRNQLLVEEVVSYDALIEAVTERRVQGVVWTNPSNPTGTIFSRQQIARLVEACTAHRVHLISDEVYGTCVFGREQLVSVLDYCVSDEHKSFVHVVSGLAKLGWSGAKLGFAYTESPQLIKAMRALSRLAPVATPGAVAATRMLTAEGSVLEDLLATNAKLLRNQYQAVATQLERVRIPYLAAQGGLTLVIDLRAACAALRPGWEGEEEMHDRLVTEARVHLAAGRDFGCREPGYFRMTFAEPLDGVMCAIVRIHALLQHLKLANVTARDSVMQRFRRLWERTDQIFGLLRDSSFLERPIAQRHPFLFYMGHLPAFAWNQLTHFAPETEPVDAELCQLFERGIDPDVDTGAVHANSAGATRSEWPALDRVRRFRDRVRELMPDLIDRVLAKDPATRLELKEGRIFELVYEHEAMHQETLLYMFNCLKKECYEPDAAAALFQPSQEKQEERVLDTHFAHIPANKRVLLGTNAKDSWGWDNEFPETETAVESFAIRKTPITNIEFVPFLVAGGYSHKELWDEDDWAWVVKEKITHPLHWVLRDGEQPIACSSWMVRQIGGSAVPIDGAALNWPVQVSQAEAKAWCRWRADGSRLPTETEWYHAAYSESSQDGFKYREFPWGSQQPTPAHGNFNFAHFGPTNVMAHPASRSYWGLYDLLGNGWEWTSTPFQGFPRFEPMLSTYPGYSADFFDGKHFVLRGGSFATVNEELRRSFRNWYQGRYPFVFSAFRPVRPVVAVHTSGNMVRLEEAASEEDTRREFAAHVKHGLSLPLPKLSSLYFYDDEGSKIYEDITRLGEYYLTRTEHAILRSCKGEVAEICAETGQVLNLLEFGAGDGHKTQTLIDHFTSLAFDLTYYPIDISEGALQSLLQKVRAPRICPVVANNLVGASYVISQTTSPTLALFLGSSIGNYDLPDAIAFLHSVNNLLRVGDLMLIGFDLKKDLQKLHSAYFDSQGVTSQFNVNLLRRMNRELGANFDLDPEVWQHRAVYNGNVGAMESWIIPTSDQTVTLGPIAQNATFLLRAWEGIRAERSYKYTLDLIKEMAAGAGFSIVKNFVEGGYCVSLWKKG